MEPAKAGAPQQTAPSSLTPASIRHAGLGQPSPVAGSQASSAQASVPAPSAISGANPVQGSSQAERIGVIQQIKSALVLQQPSFSSPSAPSGGGSSVTVQIHPAYWGEVTISVSLDSAQVPSGAPSAATGAAHSAVVTATIASANPSVRDILQAHFQDLAASLTSAGFHVDKLSVVAQSAEGVSAGAGGSAFHENTPHQGQTGNGGGWSHSSQSGSAQTGWTGQGSAGTSFGAGRDWSGDGAGMVPQDDLSEPAPAAAPVESAAGWLRTSRVDYRI